jgi:hypothetical protein
MDGQPPPPLSPAPTQTGRVLKVLERADGVELIIRPARRSGAVRVHLAAVADHALAARATADLRRMRLVILDFRGRQAHCLLLGARRQPIWRSVPLSAALAIVSSGVPATVRLPAQMLI